MFVPQVMCLELVDYLVIPSGFFAVMLAPFVRVSFRLWFDLIGAKWRRCINVRFGESTVVPVGPGINIC